METGNIGKQCWEHVYRIYRLKCTPRHTKASKAKCSTTICSSVLLRRASSKRLALSLKLQFWNVSVSTWSWTRQHKHHAKTDLASQWSFVRKGSVCAWIVNAASLPAATVGVFQILLPEISSAVRVPSWDLKEQSLSLLMKPGNKSKLEAVN